MRITRNIPVIQHSTKIIASLLMCFCLFFLTGVNFIVFPQGPLVSMNNAEKQEAKDPSAPVEEKSSSSNTVSMQEEYLHECHTLNDITAIEVFSQHKHLPVENLPDVHFELISPPPDA